MAQVAYHTSGKPYLRNGEAEISITHSKDIVAVILHDTKVVGIDIEYISPRVERIKHRFLSASELALANTTALLTLYWSAKETLFKLDKKQGLEFNTELAVTPSKSKNILNGKIRNEETITVHYSTNKDWVMTYAISNR
jgi:4'-phosphopantetheinyl transferase